jgi:hypothetical protein
MKYALVINAVVASMTIDVYHVVISVIVVKEVENTLSFRAWYVLAKTGFGRLRTPVPRHPAPLFHLL